MLRRSVLLALALLSACGGGGGGGGATPPVAEPARLAADDLDLGPATTGVDLVVRLVGAASPAPVLLEVAVELPPALTLAATDRLRPEATLATLDGDFKNGRFVILCGDAQNVAASPLQPGPLFRLRLVTSTPRQPGTYTVLLRDLRAATNDGGKAAAETQPTSVQVTVR